MNGTHQAINFPLQPWQAPGVFTRCDRQTHCVPFRLTRIQHSLDFLCCEDMKGYCVVHIVNPMLLRLFLGSFWHTWFATALFEIYEILMLVLFHTFGFASPDDLALETLPGSIVGDAFINGFIGAILGEFIILITQYLTPWTALRNAPRTATIRWLILKYVALWGLCLGSSMLISIGGYYSSNTYLGIQIAIPLQIGVVWLVYRWLTSFEIDKRVVLISPGNQMRRDRAFLIWTILALIIFSQSSGLIWAANDWYQVWFVSFFLILAMGLIWLLK